MQNKNTISGTKAGKAFQTIGGPSQTDRSKHDGFAERRGEKGRFRAGLVQPRKMG